MDYLFPRSTVTAWLGIAAVMIAVMLLAVFTRWTWLWDHFGYFAVPYIVIRGVYVYWPRKGKA
jgi:hypothetical protein